MANFPGKKGTGERFAACKSAMTKKGNRNPGAICGKIMWNKYGKKGGSKLIKQGK